MPVTNPPAQARALYDARRTRMPIAPFTDADPSLGMADGYAVQEELIALLLADGDRVIGHKVGLTSKPMQKMVGVDSPDYGPVLASTVYRDGDTIPLDRFIQPKIEAEIVFVLGRRLQGPGVTVTEAHGAIAGAVAAMEIVDSRIEGWRIKLADTVADLASNGAMAISSRIVPLDGLDARLIGMTLTRKWRADRHRRRRRGARRPGGRRRLARQRARQERCRTRTRPPNHDRRAARRRADDCR
nr:fumarylacetoacetate hydrolase family protein [Pseudonocardia sp.]